jgi:hypothetical protein
LALLRAGREAVRRVTGTTSISPRRMMFDRPILFARLMTEMVTPYLRAISLRLSPRRLGACG